MGAFFSYIAPPGAPVDPSKRNRVREHIQKWSALKRKWKVVGFFWGLVGLRKWAGVDEAIQTCDDHLRYLGLNK